MVILSPSLAFVIQGLLDSHYSKDGLWVNYYLADGNRSPYVASLLGNLRHWLENDPEIDSLAKKLPSINREEVCKR